MLRRKSTSKKELDEIIEYWCNLPRGSTYLVENTLIQFLEIFTPRQIKGGMYIAKSKGRPAYFRYLCGILHNWRKSLEKGEKPRYFNI